MWPFNLFKQRRYEREYRAAWTLFLVLGTLRRLSSEQQGNVSNLVKQLLLQAGVNGYLVGRSAERMVLVYAAQLSALRIPPAVAGEQWPLPEGFSLEVLKPQSLEFGGSRGMVRLMRKSTEIAGVYRRGGKAVEDARRELAARFLPEFSSCTVTARPGYPAMVQPLDTALLIS